MYGIFLHFFHFRSDLSLVDSVLISGWVLILVYSLCANHIFRKQSRILLKMKNYLLLTWMSLNFFLVFQILSYYFQMFREEGSLCMPVMSRNFIVFSNSTHFFFEQERIILKNVKFISAAITIVLDFLSSLQPPHP